MIVSLSVINGVVIGLILSRPANYFITQECKVHETLTPSYS